MNKTSTNDFLIERDCPVCGSVEKSHLFSLSYDRLFPLNPTYKKEWFNEHTFKSDYLFPFVRCKKCDFVFAENTLSEQMQFDYYNNAIDEQTSRAKIFKRTKRAQLIECWKNLHALSDQSLDKLKVLDYGAGWGDFLAVAKSPGVDVFGLEFDERKIAFAITQGISLGRFDLIEHNAPYDVFMCNQVLEHLDQPRKALLELHRFLKNGAVGFVSVPNFSTENMDRESEAIKTGVVFSKDIDPLGHLNYFTPENLRKLLEDCGYEIINLKGETKSEQRNNPLKRIKLKFNFGKPVSEKKVQSTSFYVKAI